MSKGKKVVLLFSSGMDSFMAGYLLKQKGYKVFPLFIDYGQKNTNEFITASAGAIHLGLEPIKYATHYFEFVTSTIQKSGKETVDDENVFYDALLPHRNISFLILAHQYAMSLGVTNIAIAVTNEIDAYPDNGLAFIKTAEKLLGKLSECKLKILLPILDMSKDVLFELASDNNILTDVINKTITCTNNPELHKKHSWGFGCGVCSACIGREDKFNEYLET